MLFRRCRAFFCAAIAVSILCAAHPVAAQDATPENSFAIKGVNVIPMDSERLLENQTVIVNNGKISRVGDSASTTTPAGMTVIDGTTRYLIPGLADLHVHVLHEDDLTNYVAWGVTTIMHLGGSGLTGGQLQRLNGEVAAGQRFGPQMFLTNRVLDGDPKLNSRSIEITDTEMARQAVRDLKSGGFDFVKTYNNIGRAEFDAVVDEAARQDLAVVGHIPRKFDALTSLGGGLNAVAHTEELFFTYFAGPRSTQPGMQRGYEPDMSMLGSLIEVMVENAVAVMPDLSFTFTDLLMWDDLELVWNDEEYDFLHPSTAAMWRRSNINRRSNIENFIRREQWKYELLLTLTREFEDAGILQVIGTDAALPGLFPGKAAHRELTELVKAGLSNYQALAVGTRNAGEFVHKFIDPNTQVGQVVPGYRADLVLLDANPLEDIRNARTIRGVSIAGRYYDVSTIETRRKRLGERYEFLHSANTLVERSFATGGDIDELRTVVSRHALDSEFLAIIESAVNAAGYSAAMSDDLQGAKSMLTLNTELFPASANTWDSLAEVNLYLGLRDEALRNYRKALQVDPAFSHAAEQIRKIESGVL